MRIRVHYSTLSVSAIAVLALFFLYFFGNYALDGELDFQFFADSTTYEKYYNSSSWSLVNQVKVDSNFLGPVLILSLLEGNRTLILILNCFLLYLSVHLVIKSHDVNYGTFLVLLFLNPLTFFSLVSVNKEIISIFVSALILYWLARGKIMALIMAMCCSILVRWQLTFFVGLLVLVFSTINPLRKSRYINLLFLVVCASFLYYLIYPSLGAVARIAQEAAEESNGTGLYSLYNTLQAQGYYFIVFIPKILHALFGLVPKFDNVLAPQDFYNDVVIYSHSLALLFLAVLLLIKKSARIRCNVFYISVLYCVVFGLSPIYAPRYFYPVYFFWCVLLSLRTRGNSSVIFSQTRSV